MTPILRVLSTILGGAFALALLALRRLFPSLARAMDEDDTTPGRTK